MSLTGHERPINLTDDWLTPRYIIEALGEFDLDPCASLGEGQMTTAKRMIRLPEDGLEAAWNGRVWLNPPYSRFAIGRWLQRLADHGDGIALVFARSDSKWFQNHVLRRANAILWMSGRIRFLLPDGQPAPNTAGAPSVLAAYGSQNVAAIFGSRIAGIITVGSTVIARLGDTTLEPTPGPASLDDSESSARSEF